MLIQKLLNKFFLKLKQILRLFFVIIFLKNPVIKTGFFVLAAFILTLSGCDIFSLKIKKTAVIQIQDKSFTLEEFSKILAKDLSQLDPLSAKDPQIVKNFKNKIITDFIVNSMIELWTENQKIVISPSDLDQELKKTIDQFPNDQTFREELAEQELSFQKWKKTIELGLKRQKLFTHLNQQTTPPSDEDTLSYYNNNKEKFYQNEMVLADSILVDDENQADIVKKLYSKKNSFESLFQEYSKDKKSQKTASIGWIERTPESNYEQLFVSKKTDLVGPIKFDDGYRLFLIKSRKPSQQKKFEEVKKEIFIEIQALRESARFSAWLDEQIKVYKIYKNSAALDSITIETRNE